MELTDPPICAAGPFVRSQMMGSVRFGSMTEQVRQQPRDSEGERVRRLRLRADGQRPLVVNLRATISLTRKLLSCATPRGALAELAVV